MAVVDLSTLPECRPIPGCEHYWASRDGLIFSDFADSWHRLPAGRLRLLKTAQVPRGYRFVSLIQNGKRLQEYVHTLVLQTFVGSRPSGMQAMHLDNNPENNSTDNLQWGTPVENNGHKAHFGTLPKGSKNGYSKLTEREVIAIRAERAAGAKKADLAVKYSVCEFTIYLIYKRKIWKHV